MPAVGCLKAKLVLEDRPRTQRNSTRLMWSYNKEHSVCHPRRGLPGSHPEAKAEGGTCSRVPGMVSQAFTHGAQQGTAQCCGSQEGERGPSSY